MAELRKEEEDVFTMAINKHGGLSDLLDTVNRLAVKGLEGARRVEVGDGKMVIVRVVGVHESVASTTGINHALRVYSST